MHQPEHPDRPEPLPFSDTSKPSPGVWGGRTIRAVLPDTPSDVRKVWLNWWASPTARPAMAPAQAADLAPAKIASFTQSFCTDCRSVAELIVLSRQGPPAAWSGARMRWWRRGGGDGKVGVSWGGCQRGRSKFRSDRGARPASAFSQGGWADTVGLPCIASLYLSMRPNFAGSSCSVCCGMC